MGHPGTNAARNMLKRGLGEINGVKISVKQFNSHDSWCDTCAKVKCKNKHHQRRKRPDAGWPDHPNHLHGTDTMGRETVASLWGERYSTVVKDFHDGKTWCYAHKHKDDVSEVLEGHEHDALIDARQSKSYAQYGGTVEFPVRSYRNDNAGEFVGEYEQERRRVAKIGTQPTVPNYGHGQQNAVAERGIALVRTISNALIHSDMHDVPEKYAVRLWPYADKHAANLLMLRPTSHNLDSASPAEKRYPEGKGGNDPEWIARVVHIWGSRVVVVDKSGKRDPAGRDLTYVGVPDNFAPGILCWDVTAPRVRPRVFNSYTFQEDVMLDRRRFAENQSPAIKSTPRKQASGSDEGDDDVPLSHDVHDDEPDEILLLDAESDSGASEVALDPDDPKEQHPGRPPKTPHIHVDHGEGQILLWTKPEDDSSSSSSSPEEESSGSNPAIQLSFSDRVNLAQESEESTVEVRLDQVSLDSGTDNDDGWGGRWMIGKRTRDKKRGRRGRPRHLTVKAIYNELRRRDPERMKNIDLDTFRSHNDNADAHARPAMRTPEGGIGFLWIPTEMGDQRQEDSWKTKRVTTGEESESSVGAAASGAELSPKESKAAAPVDEDDHNSSAFAAFQMRRHEEFSAARESCCKKGWFRTLARTSKAVSMPYCGTEELLNRATVMLEQAREYGHKSVHVGKRKQRNLYRRGQALFKMANAVLSLAVANLTRGLEGIRARDIPEPKSYKEALESDYREFWKDSIGVELANIEEHGVWEWVDLPRGRRCIDTTWAFKVKTNAEGTVDKLKSRLCGRGFKQIFGIDFTESYAPVTVLASWRACLAEAARYKWDVDIWDVKGAYLNSPLKEVIYCKPPLGMSTKGHEGQVLLLKKALYGLKQAGRAWNQKFTTWLVEHAFEVSDADPCLFLKTREIGGTTQHIRMCVYVDDVCAFFSHKEWYRAFKQDVMDADNGGFRLSASDDDNVFLGVSIERLNDGAIKIHQSRYVRELLDRFLKKGESTARVPHFSTVKLSKEMSPKTADAIKEMALLPYRSMIGALNHLANYSRPDIACAVNICAQFCANPGKQHYKAALQIMKYLAGTVEYGIIYGRKRTDHIPYAALCAYSDSSWADDPDDRTSRSGIMLWSWGGPIEWRSSKQTAQALSTTEAEYMAVCGAVKSVVWARRLFAEFGYGDLSIPDRDSVKTEAELEGAKPVTVFEDNTGAIVWSHNAGVDHQRTKHIDLKWHYVRAQHKAGAIKLVYCPTDEMVADLLTKYLAAPRFELLRDMMVAVS